MTANNTLNDGFDFLQSLWMYTSLDARCYSIVVIKDSVAFKHFCLDGDYEKLLWSIRNYIEKNIERWNKNGYHVYFQVLPLSKKPEKGRGSSSDVRVGQWLWCDLDYKEVVDVNEFSGCRESNDHSLECYYSEGGKWVRVKRPPLTEVLREVEQKLGHRPTFVVDSGCGYHLYFKLSYEVDSGLLSRIESRIIEVLGGDPQSKDLSRILRLPGSVNPRVGRVVRVVYRDPESEIDPEELEERLKSERLKPRAPKTAMREGERGEGELRELGDEEILKVIELLKEGYKPGSRQSLLLYLSGWLARARVSPVSAVKVVKLLHESTRDEEPLKVRLSTIVYSYKKSGIDIDRYSGEIESLTGVRPYGLEREIREDEVKGKSGLQEILEKTLGEERALSTIHELAEILQYLSPFRDSVIELMDYEKQVYAVANLRKLVIVRGWKRERELVYKEKVAAVCPTRVCVFRNPLGGVTKYEITFEGSTLQKPLVIGPTTIDEIIERLKVEGLVYNSRLIGDVMSAIIQAFIKRGKAEVRTEIESPGFYLVNDRVTAVRHDVERIDLEKLRESLSLLNELAEKWFKHVEDRFSVVIKWGAVSPFTYILKSRGVAQKHLYLYGDAGTGKTTLGRIVLRMWGLDSKHEKTGASMDTPPRVGYVLSQSTFPVLINEPGGALMREEVVEMIKNSSDGLVARGKYVKGTYVEYPSLSPLMFTSNKFLPHDDALLRRFVLITFSYGEKISEDRQKEFKENVEPRLSILREVGVCVENTVIENPDLLSGNDIVKLGETLLSRCYRLAGVEKPSWIGLTYEGGEESPQTLIIEEFVERLKKMVNDSFSRYISRVIEVDSGKSLYRRPESVKLGDRLRILLGENMVPGMVLKGEDTVIILTTLLEELGLGERVSLKSLGEMLGFDYKLIRVGVNVMRGLEVPLERMVDLLSYSGFGGEG